MLRQVRKSYKWSLMVLVSAVCLLMPTLLAASNGKLQLTVGQSITHAVSTNVKTVSIADSDVADVVVAGPREVLLNGKSIGRTTLVLWDENNVSSVYDVVVRGPFSDQKIELQVTLAEVNRTKALELGFDFFVSDVDAGREVEGGLYGGQVDTPTIPLALFGGAGVQGARGAFRYFSGGTEFTSMIRAAVNDGVLHVLAEPNVVAASGEHAEFLSGGEIPVPVASAGTQGGSSITIEWKEFGVKVAFVPTIVDSDIINLHVEPEVSSLDFGNGIELSGFRIPALRTRRAETTVELRNQELLIIGGLLMEEEQKVSRKVPILGHIPLLGYLFSDTQNMKTETELVLVVSPHIKRALPPGSVVSLPSPDKEE